MTTLVAFVAGTSEGGEAPAPSTPGQTTETPDVSAR
jgi:hypothetical protein